jgi:hypothetical protein
MPTLNSEGLITLSKVAELLPYKPRPFVPREFMTDAEIVSNAGKTLGVDIELYPNYFLCSFKLFGTNKFICLECGKGNRSFNPRMLAWIMNNYRTVGFNSINYDLNILWLSYAVQNTETLKDASNDLILNGLRRKELIDKYHFFTFKTSHVDLIEVAPLKGSLKLYMARLHAKRIQDLPIPDYQYLNEEEIAIVRDYNFNDLDGTELLFDFMKERLELRESLGREYNEDLMSKSDAQIAEVILAKEIGKLNGQRPKRIEIDPGTVFKYTPPEYLRFQTPVLQQLLDKIRKAKFIVQPSGKIAIPIELTGAVQVGSSHYRIGIGGLHSSEETVSYQATDSISIVDRDVASYYPRLITTLRLFPTSCGPNFLVAFEKIIETRLDAKARKIFSRDKGLKIVINGTSGKLSDVWSIFYSPDNTILMTVTGQLDLLMFVEDLELNGIKVISANTDGIVMLISKDQESLYLQLVAKWEQITGFVTEETRYSRYCARDVNAYFAVKLDGSVKVKGNPYNEVGSQSGTQLDTNPVTLICADAIKLFLSKNVPIEKTIRECRDFTRFVVVRNAKSPGAHKDREYLGKVIRWAYIKGETGCIQTVATNNKVAGSEGGRPFMDMPDTFPEDLDYDRYIKIATEALYDIGFLKQAKQVEFF